MISGPLHPCSRSQKWGAHFPPANSISRGIGLPLEHKWMASQGRGIFCKEKFEINLVQEFVPLRLRVSWRLTSVRDCSISKLICDKLH